MAWAGGPAKHSSYLLYSLHWDGGYRARGALEVAKNASVLQLRDLSVPRTSFISSRGLVNISQALAELIP